MFFRKIKNEIGEIRDSLWLHRAASITRDKKLEERIIDLESKVDLLKLNSVCLSDMKVIFEELARKELSDINSNLDRASIFYETKNEEGTTYHDFYLAVNNTDIEIYSDLKLMKEYEFSEVSSQALKSEVIRKAFVLYLATKILKDRVGLIKDLIGIKCNSAYMSVEDKKMEILERIGK